LLRQLYDTASDLGEAFEAFCAENCEPLRPFALFEAISAHEVSGGGEAGWKQWPANMQQCTSDAVARFEKDHAEDVRFHKWLQFVADRQLANAQVRARKAGMRIGLYLDFAVGVAP